MPGWGLVFYRNYITLLKFTENEVREFLVRDKSVTAYSFVAFPLDDETDCTSIVVHLQATSMRWCFSHSSLVSYSAEGNPTLTT